MKLQAGIGEAVEALLSETIEDAILREQSALDHLLSANAERVVIVGAGSTGKRAVRCLRSIGVEPLAIADNADHLHGSKLDGILVVSLAEAAKRHGRNAIFVVAIWNAKHWYKNTATCLAELGCTQVVPVGPLLWRFQRDFLPFFVQDLPHEIIAQKDDVLRASSIWSDEQSRVEYLGHVRWRTHGDAGSLPQQPIHESYFPDDIFALRHGEGFVDCGAYDGDTIRSFLGRRASDFEFIDAIEPSPETFERLSRFVEKLPSNIARKIRLHECALGATTGRVRFDDKRGVDSQISDQGEVTVEVRTLDDICDGAPTTYLKMDIEGAEFATLTGARNTIKRYRPIVAVCLEHYQDDLWKLPLQIVDMAPDYKMYLRTYEGDGWQTLCYAVPDDRIGGDRG